MARLRDVMAGAGSASDRLQKIVSVIAAEMVAEVCSCYVMRAGEVLELFATVGLNQDAVRRTRLRVGEGLIGHIAASGQPLALAQARGHPAFAYRPETGEDRYRSLCGVPILRGGRVRGVLTLQNATERLYSETDVEVLQTIAMLVAELVAAGELISPEEAAAGSDPGLLPRRLEGLPVHGGVAVGTAILHQPTSVVREVVAEDPDVEFARFDEALSAMHRSIDDLLESSRDSGLSDQTDILETYRMFASDRGWIARIRAAILQGLTAEAAVQRVQDGLRVRMGRMSDPYLRERLQDFEDLTARLISHLAGRQAARLEGTMPDQIVLVARSMGPAELLDYDRESLAGLVLEEGSMASHVALVARAMDIPVVGRCASALKQIEPLDQLIVDGDQGHVYVRPAEDILEAYQRAAAARLARSHVGHALRDLPGVTLDGLPVRLMVNAGLAVETAALHEGGADGIGLFRTEIPFMVRAAYPEVEAQTELYAEILDQAKGKPVVFRTLDVGADKRLPYFPETHDRNPALGWRAIRIGLDRPSMLRGQIRALIHAAAGRPVGILFPMIADIGELDFARRLVDLELDRARNAGRTMPEKLEVGVMVEVPSLLWQLDHVLASVDFISVGTNDLIQYIFAADRENQRVAQRYDPLSPSFLRVLRDIAERAARAGRPATLCGEMASRPLEAMALIGLGYRSLSVAPHALGAVKQMVRSVDCARLQPFLARKLDSRATTIRPDLRAFAHDRNVVLDSVVPGRGLSL